MRLNANDESDESLQLLLQNLASGLFSSLTVLNSHPQVMSMLSVLVSDPIVRHRIESLDFSSTESRDGCKLGSKGATELGKWLRELSSLKNLNISCMIALSI